MKKVLLFLTSCTLLSNVQAQTTVQTIKTNELSVTLTHLPQDGDGPFGKTTALGDTLHLRTAAQQNGPWSSLYIDFTAPLDSGAFYGTNKAGYKGFAQLYRYTSIDASAPQDTTYNIIGVVSRWFGRVANTSTKNIVINVWKRGTTKSPIANRTKWFVYGLPLASPAATQNVPLTSLSTTNATFTYFTTPLAAINYDVYVGYTISYNWNNLAGDTIGLRSTQASGTNTYTVESSTMDTLVSARNLIQNSANTWQSVVYDLNVGNGGDQVIYPIIRLNCPNCFPTDVKGITNENLTFYGHFPNPASNSTTIRFDLKKASDVSINLYDINGKLLNNINKNNLQPGTQEVNLALDQLAAGNYIYTIEARGGGAVAAQLSIVK